MAVDSKLKRFSATTLLMPGYAPAALPDATIDEYDRAAASWMYAGIEFGEPSAIVGGIATASVSVMTPNATITISRPNATITMEAT